MNLDEAKALAEKYRKEIEYHNKKYYEEDSPEIDDYEYDMIVRNLEKLLKKLVVQCLKIYPLPKKALLKLKKNRCRGLRKKQKKELWCLMNNNFKIQ